ncbi:hypothetical protein SAMCFNEI73_Ch1608 [Sinorhizobium americanum]|uniref:Uncharacterized protein n=1 Tax=Sinorhizobium americanum TaxID=194963 RepID=A0A1L3LLD2_9HYPH|nr:hypothetical protein SAMCFNEI73_Ch1608 [Sinorhizobium americanum]
MCANPHDSSANKSCQNSSCHFFEPFRLFLSSRLHWCALSARAASATLLA